MIERSARAAALTLGVSLGSRRRKVLRISVMALDVRLGRFELIDCLLQCYYHVAEKERSADVFQQQIASACRNS